jgi:hypothetical protein
MTPLYEDKQKAKMRRQGKSFHVLADLSIGQDNSGIGRNIHRDSVDPLYAALVT